jgi:cobalt/nickel transport system permease protein
MTFDAQYFDIGRLDRLSYGDSPVHRLDPRVKVAATALFLITVISFGPQEVAPLFPFFLFPVVLSALGGIPPGFILRKILFVSPFALFVGIFNPLLDTRTVAVVAGVPLSAGWLSFASILLKFLLTTGAALLLLATTSFPAICHALRRLGFPSLFVSQLLFLYRYLFVLAEEAMRISRARELRSFGRRGKGVAVFVRLVGILFLRTVDRAGRVYDAMLSRGFAGDIPAFGRSRIAGTDLAFLAVTALLLSAFKFFPVTEAIGRLAQGVLP